MFRFVELSGIDLNRLIDPSSDPRVVSDRESPMMESMDAHLVLTGHCRDEFLSCTRGALARKIGQVTEPGCENVCESEPPLSAPKASSGAEKTFAASLPITVLLVEDEALIRISTADLLQDSGMTVVEAGSAREALAAIGDHAVDILVTDMHLPEMNGLELILTIRETLPHLPVIFATGDRNVPGAEELDRSALIIKPYDYETLVSHIRFLVPGRSAGT